MGLRARERVPASGRIAAQRGSFDLHLDIRNLSRSGCMVELSGTVLRSGDRLILDFAGWARVRCGVVWRQAFQAGLAFEDDLPEEVIEAYREETVLAEIRRTI